MTFLRAFGWFWWDLIIGDDWHIAAYVGAVLIAVSALAGRVEDAVLAIGGVAALMAMFTAFVARESRR